VTEGKELEESNLGYMMACSHISVRDEHGVQDEHGVTSYNLKELAIMFDKLMRLRKELELEEFDG
jgi:hypothetical protein